MKYIEDVMSHSTEAVKAVHMPLAFSIDVIAWCCVYIKSEVMLHQEAITNANINRNVDVSLVTRDRAISISRWGCLCSLWYQEYTHVEKG